MRGQSVAAWLFLALLVAGVAVTPALADETVIGSPALSVFSPDNQVSPGQEVELPIYVQNSGDVRQAGPAEYVDRVTTARALSFEVLESDAPITVETGRFPVGTVPQGTQGPFAVSLTVAEDAEPGVYRVPVRVRYSYTTLVRYGEGTVEYNDAFRNQVKYLTVEVREEARFAVVDVTTAARIGGQGNVSVTVQNLGSAAARDASLQLTTASDELSLGTQSGSSRAYAGRWQAGENRTFTFNARVAGNAVEREYPLTAQVTYDDENAIRRTSRDLTVGVVPRPAQTFAVAAFTDRLYVGESATVRGTIRNTGPGVVRNAVVVFGGGGANVHPIETESAIGRLGPDETAEFAFEVAVTEAASPGPRQLNLTVRYRDDQDNRQRSDAIEPALEIVPERDWLAVSPVDGTVEIDSDNRLTVRIRNEQDVVLRDLQARLETTEPFSSESASAYVADLEPNETADLAFGLTVSDDAVATNASVTMNVTGERPDGEPVDLGTYTVPVTVTEGAGPGNTTLFVGGAILVALALGAGWWWFRR
jgi:hypothetical protein